MKVIKCDRCGTEVIKKPKKIGEEIKDAVDNFMGVERPDLGLIDFNKTPIKCDLCQACKADLYKWFYNKKKDGAEE